MSSSTLADGAVDWLFFSAAKDSAKTGTFCNGQRGWLAAAAAAAAGAAAAVTCVLDVVTKPPVAHISASAATETSMFQLRLSRTREAFWVFQSSHLRTERLSVW